MPAVGRAAHCGRCHSLARLLKGGPGENAVIPLLPEQPVFIPLLLGQPALIPLLLGQPVFIPLLPDCGWNEFSDTQRMLPVVLESGDLN